MHIDLGPVLYADAKGCTPATWCFRIQLLVRSREAPPLTLSSPDDGVVIGDPELARAFEDYDQGEGTYYWSWRVEAERKAHDQWISYRVEFESGVELTGWRHDSFAFDDICVPKRGALPNIAFFSCNGVSEEKLYHRLEEPQLPWKSLLEEHREAKGRGREARKRAAGAGTLTRGYSLLLGGGDQIYADELWKQAPLDELYGLSHDERAAFDVPGGFRRDVCSLFVRLYAEHWSRAHMRDVFARVPGVFTWDDHDIMDGWGSYDESLQRSPAYQAIYDAASECFQAFQLGGLEANRYGEGPHFLQALSFREEHHHLDLVVPDIRSGRTKERVLSEEQWEDLEQFLGDHQAGGAETAEAGGEADGETAGESREDVSRHLLFVSSIPLVHIRYRISGLPSFLDVAGLNDDLIDQWEHRNHRGERARLIMQLLRHARLANCRTTILSGDVHVGARGRITSTDPVHVPRQKLYSRAIIHQITSSGIGHPPPSAIQWLGIQQITSDAPDSISDQVVTEMLPVTTDREFVRARNWLSARFDDPETTEFEGGRRTRLWMQWFVEEKGRTGRHVQPIEETVVVDALSPEVDFS